MRLSVSFSAVLARTELEDYVRHLEINVLSLDENRLTEYVVGKLAMDQILWAEAVRDGVSLSDVCANDSQGMHELHLILTNDNPSFRPNLQIDQITNHVMFLYLAIFHAAVDAYRQGIIDAAFKLFGKESLAVMWRDTSGLPGAKLRDMGFASAPGSDLIFRHSAGRSRFSDEHPRGLDADVKAKPEFQEWVMQEWQRTEIAWKPEEGSSFA
jgi:hypothetical protein